MSYSPQPDRDPPRKATLYCPSCGHASLTDGDWIVRERATSVEYRCPVCDEPIVERERSSLARA